VYLSNKLLFYCLTAAHGFSLLQYNRKGHKQLFENSVLPVIADESCITEHDVIRCHQHFHGINIKLGKCGGLTPARRMIAKSKRLGMKTMVGCMTESSVGILAIAHLLPQLDYIDMDGTLLLSQDIAFGTTIRNGVIAYSVLDGTSVSLL
jgi:L-alanine-DL-glutamate epimerase-like enolase superfamily enzyme